MFTTQAGGAVFRPFESRTSTLSSVLVLILVALLAGSWPQAGAEPAGDRAVMRRAMEEVLSAGAAGVQVRVHDQRGEWVGTSGTAVLGLPMPVPANGHFRIGSITKMFVATVVLQLVAEGRLELDAPVGWYMPWLGLDERITVRMVLGHTSGLRDYVGEVGENGVREQGLVTRDAIGLLRSYRPQEMVDFAVKRPLWFVPGTDWRYSSTNYAVAGLLIQQLTGTTYAEQVAQRILLPLDLRASVLPGGDFTVPGPHAHGYEQAPVPGLGTRLTVDVTMINPTSAWAAGEIISTTADLDVFIRALLDGRLLPSRELAEMLSFRQVSPRFLSSSPHTTYGLGVMRRNFGATCGGYGHGGGTPGFESALYATPGAGRVVVVSVTTGGLDRSDAEAQRRFRTELDRLAQLGLCGTE